ncbi:MAG: Mth938-like domain-containing protein [Thermodesulfobacteriota bacterium]
MINDYHFGSITINDRAYNSDVIIYPDKVDAGWWRKEGHALYLADIKEIIAQNPEVLIVGTGAYGVLKVSKEVCDLAAEKGIELIVRKTEEACKEFNRLSQSGKKIVAALHLTC